MSVTLSAIENAIGSIGRLGTSAPVTLGSLVLSGIEVPDRLEVGGHQMMVVHRLPGGERVVDTLGNDPGRLELRGRFLGPNAQVRAQAVERMRISGQPVAFSAAGMASDVWIARFVYSYEAKGAVCSYELTLERPAEATDFGTDQSSLTGILGNDTESGLRTVSDMVARISEGVFTGTGQVHSIVGQLMPLATLVGAGGTAAKVVDALGMANTLSQSGSNLAATPSGMAAISHQLTTAGSGLMSIMESTGSNLESVAIADTSSLGAVAGSAGLLSAASDTGGLVNHSLAYVRGSQGASGQLPIVHA
ncbi:MAG: hypothetical protein ABF812_03540 [Gluconobacter cerinus]|uniref:hypothetical protein n=1 Tax=Gluconobacter cerinus TaxID=38307 RepID=UPI0039EA0208